MLMTLWNEFEHDEGSKIADMISTAPLIIALRVKVTTFNSKIFIIHYNSFTVCLLSISCVLLLKHFIIFTALSFTTRYSSGILISPPLPDELSLRQW